MAMIPREGFLTDVCESQIDLYGELSSLRSRGAETDLSAGPFWTLTTLILTCHTTSTLTSSISEYLSTKGDSHVGSNLPLLSTAISTIYVYGLLWPALLWAGTRWFGVGEWGVSHALGLYGYAMGVFVPISLLCLIPVGILRWTLVGLGAGSSGYFL